MTKPDGAPVAFGPARAMVTATAAITGRVGLKGHQTRGVASG